MSSSKGLIKPCPPIDPLVIEWLRQVFPDRLPQSFDVTSKAFGALVGQQNVIRALRNEYRRQSGDDLPF